MNTIKDLYSIKIRILILLIGIAITAISCDVSTNNPPNEIKYFFSFENGWEGWTARAMDTEHGDGEIEWEIAPGYELAWNGITAMKYYLNNLNDAGKIWIERPFEVEPNRTYEVTVRYEFATADYGVINLFTIITGVFPDSPASVDDLVPAFQTTTGNGFNHDVGYRWVNREFKFTVRSGSDGLVHALIGVWGTWETHRTYFVDAVHVIIQER